MNRPFIEPPRETVAPVAATPLWMLALFTLSGTLALHIFVPALPQAAADLGASSGAMQLTVSLYIIGLATGQLVYGPLSDRFGRRIVLMVGLAVYSAAGLAAALAPQASALIAARLFQALGGCAGLVLGRAIVRDTAAPPEAARRLALMNLMVIVGPGLAPIVGIALSLSLGWRSIFFVLSAAGMANLALAWWRLRETSALAGSSSSALVAKNYWQLLRSPAFLCYCIGGGCATTSMYAFIASAPFIFVDRLHRPAYEVGLAIAVLISGAWLGSVVVTRLIGRIPNQRLLIGANGLSVISAFVLLGVALSGQMTVSIATAAMFVFTLGVGVSSPLALTRAVSLNSAVIGSASGLYGFVQMAVGALCTALAGIGTNPSIAAATVLAAAGITAQVAFWIAFRSTPSAD